MRSLLASIYSFRAKSGNKRQTKKGISAGKTREWNAKLREGEGGAGRKGCAYFKPKTFLKMTSELQ